MEFEVTIKVKEKKSTPNYVVPRSNFFTGTDLAAYVMGVPCKVISEPYMRKVKIIGIGMRVMEVIDVKSMLTNIKYTIANNYYTGYDTLEEANKHTCIFLRGDKDPFPTNLISRQYWPRDCSWCKGHDGKEEVNLVNKECRIISVPFYENVFDDYFPKLVKPFVMVLHNHQVYRVLFEEYALANPN